nr:hypothetical protein [Tanacetum cinerariifolium]
MPPKPDLVLHEAPNVNETVHTAFNVELSPTKPDKDLSHTHRPSAPLIEDWVSDSEDDSEAELPYNAPSFVQTTKQVKTPRPSVKLVENSIPAANHKTAIPKPKPYGNSKNRKACFVFTTAVLQPHVTRPRPAKTVVTKPYSPPKRTINHRPSPPASNFPPKVTTSKAPKGNPQHALKDKGVIDSGCSRHMTWNMSYLSDFEEINGGYVAFGGNPKGGKITGKDTECIVLSPEFKLPDENQLLLIVPRENDMYNVDLKNIVPSGDLTSVFAKTTLDGSNLWHRRIGHINFKTMNKLVKEKAEEENVQQYVLFPLWSSGSKNPQNTNDDATFEGKKPKFKGEKHESEVHVSPSSSAKTKKHDDKTKRDAKGKKADFTNLKINITVSPIPTTRVHKDHHVTQIIGDLSSATQTRSMTRVVKDQVRLTQINNEDFHTCMFACFLSQEEPNRVHQALKDPSWIEAMKEELLKFKMQKVWVIVDLSNEKRAIGFEDPDYSDKVYKVVKALYGLHQAPRA